MGFEFFGDSPLVEPWCLLQLVRPGISAKRARNLVSEILGNPARRAEFPFPVVIIGGRRLCRLADVQRVLAEAPQVAGPTLQQLPSVQEVLAEPMRRAPGRRPKGVRP